MARRRRARIPVLRARHRAAIERRHVRTGIARHGARDRTAGRHHRPRVVDRQSHSSGARVACQRRCALPADGVPAFQPFGIGDRRRAEGRRHRRGAPRARRVAGRCRSGHREPGCRATRDRARTRRRVPAGVRRAVLVHGVAGPGGCRAVPRGGVARGRMERRCPRRRRQCAGRGRSPCSASPRGSCCGGSTGFPCG